MSKKTWIIFGGICAVLLGGLVYFSMLNRIDVGKVDAYAVQTGSKESGNIGDQVFGKADSKVLLIEYGDFQCPGCASAHPNIKKVTEKYKDQMGFVFRNFPIVSIHPNARAAAAAAEAAGLQGKYWDMHNKLYESQRSWQTLSSNERVTFFAEYANELGLNTESFKTDMAGPVVNQKISFDQAVGKKINVNSTPTFYLNGKPMEQAIWEDEAKLEETIKNLLTENGIELPQQ